MEIPEQQTVYEAFLAKGIIELHPRLERTWLVGHITHEDFLTVADLYSQQFSVVPRVEVRDEVDFLGPGKREGTWRKLRKVELKDWTEVREWKRELPMLKIFYLPQGGFSQSVSVEHWVRPTPLFQKWIHIRLGPPSLLSSKTTPLSEEMVAGEAQKDEKS